MSFWQMKWDLEKLFRPFLFLIIFILLKIAEVHFSLLHLWVLWNIGREPLKIGLILMQCFIMIRTLRMDVPAADTMNGFIQIFPQRAQFCRQVKFTNSKFLLLQTRYKISFLLLKYFFIFFKNIKKKIKNII